MPASADLQLSALANLCKASADPLRLQVLRVLREDSFGVSELCAIFDIRQPALSHHLKVLANAGLVATRREGNSIFYRRNGLGQRPGLEALQTQLFDTVDAIELPPAVEHGAWTSCTASGRKTPAISSATTPHKFRQQQDLIASYEQYADTVAQMLRDAPLAAARRLPWRSAPGTAPSCWNWPLHSSG